MKPVPLLPVFILLCCLVFFCFAEPEVPGLPRRDLKLQVADDVEARFLGILETIVTDQRTGRSSSSVEGRKKKKYKKKLNKYILPLFIGFLVIKSVLLPLVLKTLAILSGKAVVLSLMSLILAAIVGLRSIASGFSHKIDHYPKYRRKDPWPAPEPPAENEEDNYSRYQYPERNRRKRRR